MPEDEIPEVEPNQINGFREELRRLTKRMMSGDGIGAKYASALIQQELVFVQTVETNTRTVAAYLPSWLRNYAANLVLTEGFKGNAWPVELLDTTQRSCLVVGAGPSLTNEQLRRLVGYDGHVICSNKVLERVFEYGDTPSMVVVIHSTPEIAEHFKGPLTKLFLNDVEVVVSTMVHPDVTKALLEYGDPAKIHWFSPSVPDEFGKNMNHFLYHTSPCPVIDTGGNVGLFMCNLASEYAIFDTIGLLGMEQTLALDPSWTNRQAMEDNIICYAPEDLPEPFAVNQVFHGYLQTLLLWYDRVKDRKKVYNLTKNGYLYVGRREGMPYMDLGDFVRRNP